MTSVEPARPHDKNWQAINSFAIRKLMELINTDRTQN
jgi:hypothetical protein